MTPDDIGVIEQRLALKAASEVDRHSGLVVVRTDDLVTLLREFAALKRVYAQRGEAFERVAGTWREPTRPACDYCGREPGDLS